MSSKPGRLWISLTALLALAGKPDLPGRTVLTSTTSAACAILAGTLGGHHLVHAARDALVAIRLGVHSADWAVLQPTATGIDCGGQTAY